MQDIRVVETNENGSPTVIEVMGPDGEWSRHDVFHESDDKRCGNCGKEWPAGYGGQCDQCGASMNRIGAKPKLESTGDVNANLAALSRSASRDGGFGNLASQGRTDTSHPGISRIKAAADPFAKEVLEDILA